MSRYICLVFFACITVVFGNPATQIPCREATTCTVSNVDITPCADKSACHFKRGVNATINFDILPEFSASELLGEVSWNSIPFPSLDPNACNHTPCPVTQMQSQSVNYNLRIGKKISVGRFQIKWKVWNKADPSQLCCFDTIIKITK